MDLNTDSIFKGVDLKSPINSAASEISSKMSSLKSQTLGAASTTSEAIKKGVALVKENETKFVSTISDFKSSVLSNIDSVISKITGGSLNTKDFADIITYKDGLKVDTATLTKKVNKLVGFDVSNVDGFVNHFAGGLVTELNTLTGGAVGQLYTTDGYKIKITQNLDSVKSQALMAMYDRLGLSGVSNTFDNAVKKSLYSTLLSSSAQYGVVSSYSSVYAAFTTKEEADTAVITAAQYAISNGDATSLTSLTALLSTNSAKETLAATYPDSVETLLKNYKIDAEKDISDYPALATELKGLCVTLGGDNWYKKYTIMGWSYNLLLGSVMSDGAKAVLNDDETLIPLIACSGKFAEKTAKQVFITDFPQTPIITS